ncbi:uncharacterized protein LOC125435324 [Sphaerodactylus townsendi]|uniref:uncharacterized protein LOC125435324 n=1 Tax=Sphaerodactylus townsendi TaxID=933632 RepID=UPI002025D0D3|nr:uncharacterized protein LOC125435324 [Sphaerodactylus townsendi]
MENSSEKENVCAATTSTALEHKEEPIYVEMAPLEAQHDAIVEAGNRTYAPSCIKPIVDGENIPWVAFAKIVEAANRKVNPECCLYCYEVYTYQSDSSDDDDEYAPSSAYETSSSEEEEEKPLTPTPSRAATPAPPQETEKYVCVKDSFPDVWEGPVDYALLAMRVQEEVNPECCYRCGFVHMFRNVNPVPDTMSRGLKGIDLYDTVIELARHGF